MSSITGSINAERTNRWLLIGAAVLAVLAAVGVFAALANFNDEDGGSSSAGAPEGNNRTLVANEDIPAGATLRSDMFDVREYGDDVIVSNPVTDLEFVEGRVTSTEILKGNQLSGNYLAEGTGADELEEQLPFLFDKGLRAIGIDSSDVTLVGGHVRPGDFVDVIWRVREKEAPGSDVEILRVEYLFQNIEVLARTTEPVDGVVVLDAQGAPIEDLTADDQGIARRNADVAPGDSSDVIVLKLNPADTLRLMSAADLGELIFSLRPYGDAESVPVTPVITRITE